MSALRTGYDHYGTLVYIVKWSGTLLSPSVIRADSSQTWQSAGLSCCYNFHCASSVSCWSCSSQPEVQTSCDQQLSGTSASSGDSSRHSCEFWTFLLLNNSSNKISNLSKTLLFRLPCFLLGFGRFSKCVSIISPDFKRKPSCLWNDSSILIWYL